MSKKEFATFCGDLPKHTFALYDELLQTIVTVKANPPPVTTQEDSDFSEEEATSASTTSTLSKVGQN